MTYKLIAVKLIHLSFNVFESKTIHGIHIKSNSEKVTMATSYTKKLIAQLYYSNNQNYRNYTIWRLKVRVH